MTATPPDLAELLAHRFPGGTYRIEHWENWLLTDCTGAEPLPDGLVHPIALFHVPILGAGTSIAKLFAVLQAEGAGTVRLLGYDWEYFAPLREDLAYRCEGGIVSAERNVDAKSRVSDTVAFGIELTEESGRLAARITNRWQLLRGGVAAASSSHATVTSGVTGVAGVALDAPSGPAADAGRATRGDVPRPGDPIPPWTMEFVDPARMKTMAAILRDPYPVHWDRSANERAGLGPRLINQGPLNLGYLANMLMKWAGPDSVRRLTVSFSNRVHDGDRVTGHGVVRAVESSTIHDETQQLVTCDVWLERDGERLVTGTAQVAWS